MEFSATQPPLTDQKPISPVECARQNRFRFRSVDTLPFGRLQIEFVEQRLFLKISTVGYLVVVFCLRINADVYALEPLFSALGL